MHHFDPLAFFLSRIERGLRFVEFRPRQLVDLSDALEHLDAQRPLPLPVEYLRRRQFVFLWKCQQHVLNPLPVVVDS